MCSSFHLTSGWPADDRHPPQRRREPWQAAKRLTATGFPLVFHRPHDYGAVVDAVVALAGTCTIMMVLFLMGSVVRGVSDLFYRRHRIVHTIATAAPPRRITIPPIIQAILMLCGLVIMAKIVGVRFSV